MIVLSKGILQKGINYKNSHLNKYNYKMYSYYHLSNKQRFLFQLHTLTKGYVKSNKTLLVFVCYKMSNIEANFASWNSNLRHSKCHGSRSDVQILSHISRGLQMNDNE